MIQKTMLVQREKGKSTTKERKRIILVNPPIQSIDNGSRKQNIPLGLLSIGTYLLKKTPYEVVLIDALPNASFLEIIREELDKGDTIFIGLSVMSAAVKGALEITRMVKKDYPDVKVVWGGAHAKLYIKDTAKHPLIDCTAHDEGEIVSKNLADMWVSGLPIDEVRGIAFRKETGEVQVNKREQYVNMNELFPYSYELLGKEVFDKKMIYLNTSRGCPSACTFCINIVTDNLLFRAADGQKVVDEMIYLNEKFGIESFYFRDENFFTNIPRVEYIFEELVRRKKKFDIRFTCRVNYFQHGLITDKLLRNMKKAGVFQFCLGIESGSNKTLRFLKKGISVKQVYHAIDILKKYKITVNVSFLAGLPGETKEDLLETIEMIKQLSQRYPGFTIKRQDGVVIVNTPNINVNGPQVFRPYPGGELYEHIVKEYGWEMPVVLEEWETYFNELNRYKIEDYPWVQNPRMLSALQFYLNAGRLTVRDWLIKVFVAPYRLHLKILFFLFYPFAKIRTMLNFYTYPLEYRMIKWTGFLDQYES